MQIFVELVYTKKNIILTKFSLLASLEIVILTTSYAARDENIVKMTTFQFQCMTWLAKAEMT